MRICKRILGWLCTVLVLGCLLPAVSSGALAGPSVATTLTDYAEQRGSRKTFDVWARNAGGEKIRATVRHNGQKLEPTWDDNEKTSYTAVFTEEGENLITVTAASDGGRKTELTYHINYRRAEAGEEIGRAIWSVEAFTVGGGYLIEPVEVPILEGETAAEQLLRLLAAHGFVGYYGGTVKASFYLAYLADGTAPGEFYNGYRRSQTPENPRALNLTPLIPAVLIPHLEESMTFFDPDDYAKNWVGYLGEFAFSNGSGWMYAVNGIFPNVGFADSYLSDGDVVRVQFTLGYGADIGGAAAIGSELPDGGTLPSGGYFPVAGKDRLTAAICRARMSGLLSRANVGRAYRAALTVMAELDASQAAADAAAAALTDAVAHPDPEAVTTEPETEPETEPGTGAVTDEPALSEPDCTDAPKGCSSMLEPGAAIGILLVCGALWAASGRGSGRRDT